MAVSRLTSKQKRLLTELDDLSQRLSLDYWNFRESADSGDELTARLDLAKRTLIIGEIVTTYVFFDEMLNFIVSNYYFGAERSFPDLWRTKSFQRFNYYVLEKLSSLQKLALVREIRSIPKSVVAYLHKLSDLRNALAHAFFPENLRGQRTNYKQKSIFDLAGFTEWEKDRDNAVGFFFKTLFSVGP
jgi:hypothetical protein